LTLEKYFPYFDKELRKTGVTKELLWQEYYTKHPDGYKITQFRYWYREWTKEVYPVMHFTHKAGDKLVYGFYRQKALYCRSLYRRNTRLGSFYLCFGQQPIYVCRSL